MSIVCVFFFFKQKTAYEMRISDWSSDVCSSDLALHVPGPGGRRRPAHAAAPERGRRAARRRDPRGDRPQAQGPRLHHRPPPHAACGLPPHERQIGRATSELQSLMRTSYAVFCLKKKNKYTNQKPNVLRVREK